ncbi:MAG: ABC transporter substrate-binding protein, partial [Deltaproteobacteria bacterium]|nr:ABC transporter substrate-binding protein [Deltaproteobacteria bacterium]
MNRSRENKSKLITVGSILLVLLFMTLPTLGGNLFAQSFLSKSLELPDATGDGAKVVQSEKQSFFEKLIQKLKRNQPQKEEVKATESSNSELVLYFQSIESIAFEKDMLEQVHFFIDQKELNLAQTMLNKMPQIPTEEVSEDDLFILNEYRRFLNIKLLFLFGDLRETLTLGEQFLKNFSGGENFTEAYYYYAVSAEKTEQPLRNTSLMNPAMLINLPEGMAFKLREILARYALSENKTLEALSYLIDKEGKLIEAFDKWFTVLIEKIGDINDLNEIIGRFENQPIQHRLLLKKLQLLIRDGHFNKAQEFLTDLQEDGDLPTSLYGELQKHQKFILNAQNTKPFKIGVILPISHYRYKVLAEQVLEGLELALNHFSNENKPFQIIIKDSIPPANSDQPSITEKDVQEHIKKVINDLVENEQVIAILGPITKTSSVFAGKIAEENMIPLISFSLTEDIGEDSPYLFRFQRKQTQEAVMLAKYAFDYLKARRFVLFYHQKKSSFKITKSFEKEILKRGGEIVGVGEIGADQTDYQDNFASFTGGFRKITEEEQEEINDSRDRLDPIVDFDVIYAPVDPDTLNLIISFARLFDSEKAWILSGSQTNVKEN